jgi:sirohydrochlorin ferrochelatase
MPKKNSVYLLIACGSRNREENQAFLALVKNFHKIYSRRCVMGAFLERAKPSIPEAIELCVSRGIHEILVMPLVAFGEKRVQEDISRMIQEAKAHHPDLDFHFAKPLSDGPMSESRDK